MKCPDCGKRLHKILTGATGEWMCDNLNCPANQRKGVVYAEYYGDSQEVINLQKRVRNIRNKGEIIC